ncbi:MAG: YARHG domain-containing protein [bacterium]
MHRSHLKIIALLIPLFLFSFTEAEIEEFQKQSYEQFNNDNAIKAIYDGEREELQRVFSDDNLAILNEYELRLLRNMIYAQHAYAFKSKELQEWFNKFDWYEPLTSDVTDYITWVDSMNIERIRGFELAYKKTQAVDIDDDQLIGIWHVSPIVAAGYGELIYFYPDHAFKITANQMDWGNRLSSISGTWSIETNALVLEITEKCILTGGEIVEGYASCASEFAIEGGTSEIITVSPDEIRTYPVSEIVIDDLGGVLGQGVSMPRIKIGTGNFWLFSSDPYSDIQ